MSEPLFKKATRAQTKLRLALTGPAGSGKTLSALKLARGLVGPKGKIAVIDTENGSASYYAGAFDFDAAQMNPPYLVSKYIQGIDAANDYDCVIVDSLSHAWAGEGGVLQRKEAIDARGGNSFTNWAKMTPEQNALVAAVLHCKTNIICTLRSKTKFVVEQNDKGKATPKKVGLEPVQRDGFEYEFDVVLDVDVDTHTAKASKDRTGIFIHLDPFLVQETHGELISKWQKSGAATETPLESTQLRLEKRADSMGWEPSIPQVKRFWAIASENKVGKKDVEQILFKAFGTTHLYELTSNAEYETACTLLTERDLEQGEMDDGRT